MITRRWHRRSNPEACGESRSERLRLTLRGILVISSYELITSVCTLFRLGLMTLYGSMHPARECM